MQNSTNHITTTRSLQSNNEDNTRTEELKEKLQRIQKGKKVDFFKNTDGNGSEESTASGVTTPPPPQSAPTLADIPNTTFTTNNNSTVESANTTISDSPVTTTISDINVPHRRPGAIFQNLDNESRTTILDRQNRNRLLDRDLHQTGQENRHPIRNDLQEQQDAFEEINRRLDGIQANIAGRIPLRQQADVEYSFLLRSYRLLIDNTRNIVHELANFSWNHPVIATGGLIAVSGVIMMIFRNRHTVGMVSNLTTNFPMDTILSLMPSTGNATTDAVNRASMNNALNRVGITGGVVYVIRLLLFGARRT